MTSILFLLLPLLPGMASLPAVPSPATGSPTASFLEEGNLSPSPKEELSGFCGDWLVSILYWNQPGDAPLAGNARACTTLRLGDRYLLSELKGHLGETSFEGILLWGTSGERGRWNAIWLDSSSCQPTLLEGIRERGEFSWTSPWAFPGQTHHPSDRGRTIWVGQDTYLFQQFRLMPDGSGFKMLECRFARTTLPPEVSP